MTSEFVDHDQAHADLGVLVLGALDPAEREAVEAHVAGCAQCSAALAELAPMPGLLKRVDTSSLDLGAPPPEILERALAQIHESSADDSADLVELRPKRRRWVTATAIGLTAAAAVVGGYVMAQAPHPTPAHVTAAAKVVSGTDKSTGVSARVVMQRVPNGTSLALTVNGVERGDRCSLIAFSRSGKRDVTSTWVVMYRQGVRITTGTAIPLSQISRLEVATPEGDVLVSLPVRA